MISLVVAMDQQRAIGANGTLPWRLPADLRHFRSITMGKPIVMGRKTHESMGRPLPGRENIVISRNPHFKSAGCVVVPNIEEALVHARGAAEVMVIGGVSIYAATLPMATRIYLTEVHADIGGDVYFPTYELSEWRERQRTDHPADPMNPYPYSFVLLERLWKSLSITEPG